MHEPKSTITNKQLESWINEHSSFLLNRAYMLLSVKEDAEDVVQEVFLSVYQSAESFEGRSSVRTWLTAVLHNKIADLYKRKYKSTQTSFQSIFDTHGEWKEEQIPVDWGDEEELINDPEFNHIFGGCINKLPTQWKIIVSEAYFSEKKASDICVYLNITQSNYWKILQRSRIQLRKCLDINWFKTL